MRGFPREINIVIDVGDRAKRFDGNSSEDSECVRDALQTTSPFAQFLAD